MPHCIKPCQHGLHAVAQLGLGVFQVGFVDDDVLSLLLEQLPQAGKEVLALVNAFWTSVSPGKTDHHIELLVHDVGLLAQLVDVADVIFHQQRQQHVVVLGADLVELFDVGLQVDLLERINICIGKYSEFKKPW
jgi:hypothetical protein